MCKKNPINSSVLYNKNTAYDINAFALKYLSLVPCYAMPPVSFRIRSSS